MISPFDEQSADLVIIDDPDENVISFTRDEIKGLLQECMHSYISYENPIATDVIRRMVKFVDMD